MTNEEILKKNGGRRYDVCLMNPPYSNTEQYLDMKFVQKCNEIANKVISVQPAQKIILSSKTTDPLFTSLNFKEYEMFDANKAFNISSTWKIGAIYVFDNLIEYKMLKTIDINGNESFINRDTESRKTFYNMLRFNGNVNDILKRKQSLYDQLIKDHKTMVNDVDDKLVYYEQDINRGLNKFGIDRSKRNNDYSLDFVKNALKNKTYKYCLYMGSYNGEDYVKPSEWKGEDPDTFFKKQICWLTNKENILHNIEYWMACPIFDLWRKVYTIGRYRVNRSGCFYGFLPALDFDKSEEEFKKYVDSLNNFTDEEIKILKDNNIHNADKL